MTKADWAFVISIISAVISFAGFVWNVWSKFIYPKPKVRVGFSMVFLVDEHVPEEHPEALRLSAINMGPVEVTLTSAQVIYRSSPFKAKTFGLLNVLPYFPNTPGEVPEGFGPFAGGIPKKLQVGEEFAVYLTPDHETLAKGDYQYIGFNDSFGRFHWSRRRDIAETLPHIRKACEKANKDWRRKI